MANRIFVAWKLSSGKKEKIKTAEIQGGIKISTKIEKLNKI